MCNPGRSSPLGSTRPQMSKHQNTENKKHGSYYPPITPQSHHTQSARVRSSPSANDRTSTALYVQIHLFPLWVAFFTVSIFNTIIIMNLEKRCDSTLTFQMTCSHEHQQQLQPRLHFLRFLTQLGFFQPFP